jgi:hypothetical protein
VEQPGDAEVDGEAGRPDDAELDELPETLISHQPASRRIQCRLSCNQEGTNLRKSK